MDKLEEYARDGEKRFERTKLAAIQVLRNGYLTEERLECLMEEAFRSGHYTGHCRGERFRRNALEGFNL